MSLRERTVSGIAWNLLAHGGQQVLGFAFSLMLARLLVPEDFGLVGMIAVFSGFAMLFSDLGLSAAVVQRSEVEPEHLDSAFWLNLVSGLVLTVLFLVAAPAIGVLYGEPELVPLVRVLAASFVLSSASVIQRALLLRSMSFRRLALLEVTGVAVGGAVGVGAALSGGGVWSLVAQTLTGAGVTLVLLWIGSDWRPGARIDRGALRDLWSFGGSLTGFNTLNYWVRHADDFLIGRYVGAAPLGIYGRAYNIMLLPVTRVTGAIGQVMFPALSRIKDDPARSRRVYLQAIGAIACVTFPSLLGLLVVADEFVLGVLGQQWAEVIPILRLFCLVGVTQSIGATTGWIYQAQGRTDWLLRWGVGSGIFTLAAFVAGLPWGVIGVTIAYLLRTYALTYFNFSIPGRLIGLRFGHVVRRTASVLLVAGAMAGIVAAVDVATSDRLPALTSLGIQTAVGVFTYTAAMYAVKPRAFEDTVEIVRGLRRARAAPVPPVDGEGFAQPEGPVGEPTTAPKR